MTSPRSTSSGSPAPSRPSRPSATSALRIAGTATTEFPLRHPDDPDNAPTGAAVFTKRGDHTTIGWLADHYASAQQPDP